MAEQGNSDGTANLSPRSISQQGQGYSLGTQAIRSMDVVDEMVIGGTATSPQRISSLDRSVSSHDNLAPIFPPQNFEVPDISFSNSVTSNTDFNHSMLSSAQMYGNTNNVFTNVSASSGHLVGEQPGHTGPQISSRQQVTYFPTASRSPPGTSSSDDSDDLPLAQLAKRGMPSTASHSGTNAAHASPSAPSTDTTSMEGSPLSGPAPKKAKQTKRKKKKDPNEPQKPVSAYALFFRDTQATIKGHNPSASFGEVSKIVASMWEQLDPEHKDVYKKKTEMAKKQYLKQLAAYRASQVSQQSATDEAEKSPSPPGAMAGATNFQALGVAPPGSNMAVNSVPGQVMLQQRPHIQQQQSPQHLMQMSPQMMQHQQQHMQKQLIQQQQHVNVSQPSQQSHQHSPPQEMSTVLGPVYTSPPHVGQTGPTSYRPTMMDHSNDFGFSDPDVNMDVTYPQCVRSGCRNHARDNPAWDSEYCSNDCVITHCRDIFKNWVASRSGTSTHPVK